MGLITVPRPLREKLGEEASDALVSLINQAGNGYKAETIELVEERFERRLAEEIGKLDTKLSETKADLLRWMFIFWVGQVGALLGILFAFFRH